MAKPRRRTITRKPASEPPPEPARAVAVVDIGASAIRLVVAEAAPLRVLDDASRAVQLGKDTFTHGRLGGATMEAALKALEGFRRILDTYGVVRYRAVATSAVREASNRDTFLDRIRLRTGLDVEVIDGSEENRLTYVAVRDQLRSHEAWSAAGTLLAAVGGGSADLSFLRKGQPLYSGTYALGSIRMRQSLASWNGSHEQRVRLLRRHIHNVVEDIRRALPLREVTHLVALGGDARFAATHLLKEAAQSHDGALLSVSREAFVAFADQLAAEDVETLVERRHLPLAEAETLVPALLAYRELLNETQAQAVLVPGASLRSGLLLDLLNPGEGDGEDFGAQVIAGATSIGGRYGFDAAHAKNVAALAVRVFDELRTEHGLGNRDRLLLEVAALLHDIGIFVNVRGHHKHSHYLISVSEIFGLTREDLGVVANVARYHRRALPQRSHVAYMALDSDSRIVVNKLAAILRFANALDADHLQKVRDVKVAFEDGGVVIELDGSGDLTMERLAASSRSDLMSEVFGRRVTLREGARG
jgi:exopolyphosphatase/guanosine-5'-triphosphate,3'-diphosphate pyrophosphatase